MGQFLSGYFPFTVCFAISGTFMTVLCLFNNISRHIKDNVWDFEFCIVTKICSNFLDLEIMFLYYYLYTVELLYISSTNA